MTTLMDNVLEAPDTVRYTDPTDFSALLDKEFKPKTDEARDAVEAAVRTLAEQALVNAATMSFSKIKQEYSVQNAQGGSGGAVTAGYDIKGNKES